MPGGRFTPLALAFLVLLGAGSVRRRGRTLGGLLCVLAYIGIGLVVDGSEWLQRRLHAGPRELHREDHGHVRQRAADSCRHPQRARRLKQLLSRLLLP